MADRLRILQVVQKPQRRGAEVFASQLSASLRATGEATVRTAYLYPNAEPGSLPLVEGDVVLDGDESSPLEKRVGANPLLLRRLGEVIDGFGPHIVQANGARTVKYAALAGRLRPRLTVVYRNIGDPAEWVDDRRRRFFYSRVVLPRLDGVISVSERTLEGVLALRHKPTPTVCIPRAVDVESFQPVRMRDEVRDAMGTPRDVPVVLYVGSLTQEKRPDRLARVYAAIREKVPEAELWVAGSGPLGGALAADLDRLGVGDQAHLLGVHDAVADLMNAADLLVLVSDTEGTPGAVLEAGAAGLASVATLVGGVSDCVADGRTGVLVDPEDEAGFAAAAVALLRDPFGRKRMGIEARHWVAAHFALKAITQDYLGFYRRVLRLDADVASNGRRTVSGGR